MLGAGQRDFKLKAYTWFHLLDEGKLMTLVVREAKQAVKEE